MGIKSKKITINLTNSEVQHKVSGQGYYYIGQLFNNPVKELFTNNKFYYNSKGIQDYLEFYINNKENILTEIKNALANDSDELKLELKNFEFVKQNCELFINKEIEVDGGTTEHGEQFVFEFNKEGDGTKKVLKNEYSIAFKNIMFNKVTKLVLLIEGNKNYIYPIFELNGIESKNDNIEKVEEMKELFENYEPGEGINLVIYGTPGCGKSFILNEMLKKSKYIDNNGNEKNGLSMPEDHIIRTTFHHDYSNTDFVGQIVPQVKSDGSATYVINPGPFTKALTLAFNTGADVALVIEELNRGDAAGIFGDIFQLLDRLKETNEEKKEFKGVSQYPIVNDLIQTYLTEHTNYRFNNIRIPSNLYIFATMNTSDQNVFTLDTAFKRRWNFLKMKNNYIKYDKDCGNEILYVPGSNKKWTDFVEQLNKKMLKLNGQINEDKQLGLYFVDKDLLSKKENEFEEERNKKFAFKVLEYLWDDVVRYDHSELFDSKIETLDDLVDKFVKLSKEGKESTLVFKDDTFNQNENE